MGHGAASCGGLNKTKARLCTRTRRESTDKQGIANEHGGSVANAGTDRAKGLELTQQPGDARVAANKADGNTEHRHQEEQAAQPLEVPRARAVPE